jgi:hypothetical protein
MGILGVVAAILAAVCFLLATVQEYRRGGMTPAAWAYLGLLLLTLPAGVAAALSLTD